jgi:hypothetical protein
MKLVRNELKPWGVFIGWGKKFEHFRGFFCIFWDITVKMVSFSVQMIEFIFKRSNLNSNRLIKKCRITATHRPQRRMVMRTVLLDPTQARAVPLGCYHSTRLKRGRYRPVRAGSTPTVRSGLYVISSRRYRPAGWRYRPPRLRDRRRTWSRMCVRASMFSPNCPLEMWELLTAARRSETDWSDHKGNTEQKKWYYPIGSLWTAHVWLLEWDKRSHTHQSCDQSLV